MPIGASGHVSGIRAVGPQPPGASQRAGPRGPERARPVRMCPRPHRGRATTRGGNTMATTPGTTSGTGRDTDRGGRFDREGSALARRSQSRLTTETKHSSKTTEFYAYVAATVGVLLAGLLTRAGDGHDDRLGAGQVWLFISILTVGYMLSRGLAKSGSRDPYRDDDRS